jgi:hypothetical protein
MDETGGVIERLGPSEGLRCHRAGRGPPVFDQSPTSITRGGGVLTECFFRVLDKFGLCVLVTAQRAYADCRRYERAAPRPTAPGPTSTPPDPAPTHPLALGTSMDHPVAQHHRPTIQRLTTATQPDDQDRQEKLGRPAAKPRPPANTIKIKHSTHHHGSIGGIRLSNSFDVSTVSTPNSFRSHLVGRAARWLEVCAG